MEPVENSMYYGDDDYWRRKDEELARLEELKGQKAWLEALEADRAIKAALAPPVVPKKKRPPKGSTPRARALKSWRQRAARGLPDRCARCKRKTIAHRGHGYCRSCYGRVSGENLRTYLLRRDRLLAWKAAHKDRCRLYRRRSASKPEAKRERNSRLRRQRREKRAEELRVLRERNREERRRWLVET